MIVLYYLLVLAVLALAGPFLLLRRKSRFGLAQKLGVITPEVRQKSRLPGTRVWFHTVSVGEFNATLPLLVAFRAQHPQAHIFVSTSTGTGQQLAREKVGDWATVFYFPFDLPWACNSWLDAIKPDVVAITETELWPGFTYECKKRSIKLISVNGRISPRSFERYKILSPIFSPVIERFDAIAAQSQTEAMRYVSLGASPEVVRICGNMKFDGMTPISEEQSHALRSSLGLGADDMLLVGGSTHEGEEAALLHAVKAVAEKYPNGQRLRLVLAPRHPERFQRVFQVVEGAGYRVRSYSRQEAFERDNDVFVVDTIGQLMNFYSLASIAFVGGTLAPIGGHNLSEPYLYSVPVLCGPHVEKTRDVAESLSQRGALGKVENAAALAEAVINLYTSPEQRQKIGAAGKLFVDSSQGAVARTMIVLNYVLPRKETAEQLDYQESSFAISGDPQR